MPAAAALLTANSLIALCYYAIAALVGASLWQNRAQGVNALGLSTAGIFLTCALGHSYHALSYLLSSAAPAAAARLFVCPLAQAPTGSAAPIGQLVLDSLTLVPAVSFLALRQRYGLLARGEGVVLDYERTLAQQRGRHSALTAAMADAVVIADAAGQVVEVNPALATLVGREAEQIVGRPLAELLAKPAQAPALVAAIQAPVRSLDLALRGAQGQTIAVRWNAAPVQGGRGADAQLVAVGHDMRELHAQTERLEAEVASRTERLQNALAEQQQLLELVRAQSTPVIPILRDTIVVPLIGILDGPRGEQLASVLLHAIAQQRCRRAVIDVTGVSLVDAQGVTALLKAITAARLLGTSATLSGVGPELAQSLVASGHDLSGMTIAQSLANAVEGAAQS